MTTDVGRSAADAASGYSAEPEPGSTVSAADAVSIPNADDVRFLGAGPDHRGGFTFSFADGNEDGAIHAIAEHLYAMMGCGTPHELNCVQMEVMPRGFAQAFTLTLQREGGKSPLRLKAEAVNLLKQALEAIESNRSEQLFIMRDAIRNWLEDDPASRMEAQRGETGTGSTAEGGDSLTAESGDAQTPNLSSKGITSYER